MLLYGNVWHLMELYGNAVVTRPNFRKAQLGRRESDKVQSYSYGFHMDHLCMRHGKYRNTQVHKYKYTDIIHMDFTQSCLGCS